MYELPLCLGSHCRFALWDSMFTNVTRWKMDAFILVTWEPSYKQFMRSLPKSCEISFCSNFYSNDPISLQFCTCHVMTCTKLWPEMTIIFMQDKCKFKFKFFIASIIWDKMCVMSSWFFLWNRSIGPFQHCYEMKTVFYRVPTGPYFREKSLFSIVALPALEKSLLLNIFDRSPGKVLIFNRCDKT